MPVDASPHRDLSAPELEPLQILVNPQARVALGSWVRVEQGHYLRDVVGRRPQLLWVQRLSSLDQAVEVGELCALL